MVDIYVIVDGIYFDHCRYVSIDMWATQFNFRLMSNLFEFGKEFHR